MEAMARIGGTAYLLGSAGSALSGWLSDRWIVSGASPSLSRKTFTGGGIALAGLCAGIAAVSGPVLCVVAISGAVIFFGVCASNVWSITQTLAGSRATGRWAGFQSFFGNLAGIVSPALTGYVLQRTGHFYWAFFIVMGVALIGAASWFFLVGRVQPVVWKTRENRSAAVVAPSEM
jgi:MFS family permease